MECYSGRKGQPPCSSLLGRNTTKAECCCTQGASWGEACDVCPAEDSGKDPEGPRSSQGQLCRMILGEWGQSAALSKLGCLPTVEFSEICPSGKGYIPVEGAWMFGQTTYTGNLPTDPDPQTPLT